jgi:hypothetical protein
MQKKERLLSKLASLVLKLLLRLALEAMPIDQGRPTFFVLEQYLCGTGVSAHCFVSRRPDRLNHKSEQFFVRVKTR